MWAFCTLILIVSVSTPVRADTFTYNNTGQPGNIDTNVSCTAPVGGAGAAIANLERTFNVDTHFSINDLNVGFIANHNWRGDIEVSLVSPAGTTVVLLVPDTNASGNENNWDLALDDEAAGIADDNTDDVTAAPNYAADRSGQPGNPLSAFDNEDAFGLWTIRMCEKFPTDTSGTYVSSQLLFDGDPIADLVISKTSSASTYTPGVVLTYTLTVSNNGPENASGITVADNLPAGLTLNSAVTCSASGTASCGAATFGTAGDTGFSDTAASIDAGAGNSLTYTVPVLPSTDMTDY